MTTNLLAAAALALVSSLGLIATVDGSPAPNASVVLSEMAPVSVVEVVTDEKGSTAWNSVVNNAIPSAAAACGVVAIKNAPAAIVVTFEANGAIASATSESSLFGGAETDACLRNELGSLPRVGAPAVVTTVRTNLAEIQVH